VTVRSWPNPAAQANIVGCQVEIPMVAATGRNWLNSAIRVIFADCWARKVTPCLDSGCRLKTDLPTACKEIETSAVADPQLNLLSMQTGLH
jgi:hypothetical protein